MSKRRLVVTAVLSGQSQAEVARRYGVSQGWISKLMARYRTEGEAAFEARSKAPRNRPTATSREVVEAILTLRDDLTTRGLDAGAETIAWHLEHRHNITISRATINRVLTRAGRVIPEPKKRPKSSYIRFAADQPNECWQSDITHYRLTRPDGRPGIDAEIITWLDDHSRFVVHASAHKPVTAKIVLKTFREAAHQHGYPQSTLTDNAMVYTVRFATGKGGRNHLEHELHRLAITQKNGRPNHPTTQGKVERFQATMKKWLTAQPNQPTNIIELQALIDEFIDEYNNRRPHRSLPHHATPATSYQARPKAAPAGDRSTHSHDRVRTDRIDKTGRVTLRYAGKLYKIGVGRAHARTPVTMLIQDRDIRIINAATGEVLRELTLDPTRTYQPTGKPETPAPN